MNKLSLQEATEVTLKSGFFDFEFYSQNYMYSLASPREAALDYLRFSGLDHRSPSLEFDALRYAIENQDVAQSGANLLLHYLCFGHKEGRRVHKVEERKREHVAADHSLSNFNPSLALHIHLYYLDAVNALKTRLSVFPGILDVYVSIPEHADPSGVEAAFRSVVKGKLVIERVPNRGRNFAPLFVTFSDAMRDYDFIGHVHTKKSLYSGCEQVLWRNHLWSGVLGSPGTVHAIFRSFASKPDLMLVSSDRFPGLPFWADHWLQNASPANSLAERMGLTASLSGFVDYPVGGMFWARGELLTPFFDLELTYNDFPQETGQKDGTLQHALERMLGVVARQRGNFATYSPQRGGVAIERDSWLHEYAAISKSTVRELVESHDVVSFDLFDTLVVRDAASTEVAKQRVSQARRSSLDFDYESLRNAAELKARERKNWAGDVNMQEIATELSLLADIDAETSLSLLNDEFLADYALLSAREAVVELYEFARSIGKRIAITSDTFYPLGSILKILEKCNISKPDYLYLSSEMGARKDRGDIWSLVKQGAGDGTILHIGDNAVSDVQRASDAGLSTVLVLSALEKCLTQGVLHRPPTDREWPFVRDIVKALGDDPFFDGPAPPRTM